MSNHFHKDSILTKKILLTFTWQSYSRCNLERLKLWDCDKRTLSQEARLGISIFNRIDKGVDGLHIKNHVRHSC